MLKKTYQKGFTVVELLIVIVVIGILAALVLNTFAGIQQRARDTERKTDMNAVATQLEVYYNDNASYPAFADLNAAAWVEGNLAGLDEGALTPPNANAVTLVNNGTPGPTAYGYVPSPAGCDSPTDAAGDPLTPTTPCESFILYWEQEDENAGAQEKASLN